MYKRQALGFAPAEWEWLTVRAANAGKSADLLESVGLIGKTVEISTAAGTAQGTVTTVTFSGGQPLLSLRLADGSFLTEVSPANVTLIR